MTKEEIIEILRKNVELYKDEPEFVEYIVNLAIYLIEYQKIEDPQGKISLSEFEPIESIQKFILERRVKCHNCGKIYEKAGICPECGAFND